MSDRDDSRSGITDLPKQLVSDQATPSGFFAGLRESAEKEKARPPPWRLSHGHYYVFFITQ